MVAELLSAANGSGMNFDEYVAWRLSLPVHDKAAIGVRADPQVEDLSDSIAVSLYQVALEQRAEEVGDDYHVEARPYLVEDLYKLSKFEIAWEHRDRGSRIMIGKAFKRYVGSQTLGRLLEDGRIVKVEFHSRTAQNQTRYKTVRIG
jgi:hypothetical protein